MNPSAVIVVSPSGVDLHVVSRVSDDATVSRRFDFPAGADVTDALKEVVAANPLLTSDYHSVDIVIDNNRYFVMAHDDYSDAEARRRVDLLWNSARTGVDLDVFTDTVEPDRTHLVWAMPHSLTAYVRRIWNNPRLHHAMGAAAQHYAHKSSMGNMGKIYARLGQRRVDVFAFGRDGLLLVNSFDTLGDADTAAYYILSVAKHLDFDPEIDRIIVGPHDPLRDSVISRLRTFVPTVVPDLEPFEFIMHNA